MDAPASPRRAAAILLLAAASCSNRGVPIDPAPASASPSAAPPPVTAAPTPAPLPALAGGYRGVLDPDLPITMRLVREGDAVTGRYFYESKGADLTIEGKIAPDGAFTLEEKADGKITGTFRGAAGPSGELSGTWTDPKGGTRSFRLDPIACRPRGPAIILRKWHRARGRPKVPAPPGSKIIGCNLDVAYPEVFGLAGDKVEAIINDKLRLALLRDRAGQPCESPYATSGSYAVHMNRDGILSVSFTYDNACEQCAHPSFGGAAVNVLVDTGADLPLDRLLAPGGRARLAAALAAPLADRIAKTAGASAEDAGTLRDAYLAGDYVIEDKGLRLIAFFRLPHALQALDGDFGVLLPWAAIRPAIDPAGPVASLAAAP